jgi:hypothetical protein
MQRQTRKQLTSMIPSTEHETRYWPSGENRAHSGWVFFPNCKDNSRLRVVNKSLIRATPLAHSYGFYSFFQHASEHDRT